MKKNLFLGTALLFALASSTSFGDITLTFDSDTQGWASSFGNGSVAWSAEHGGSLQFTADGSGWTNPLGVFSMTSTPEFSDLFGQIMQKGGTLTFDYIIRQEDIVGYTPASPPGWFELVAVGNSDENLGGGWDQNVIGGDPGYYGGIPEGWTTKQVTLGLTAGAPSSNDGIISWGMGSGWNELLIGLNSQTNIGDDANNGPTFTSATFYIDNMQFSAIPEPGSLLVVGIFGTLAMLRRKR